MSNTRMYLLNLKIKLASCKIIAATNAAKNASQIIADSAACLIKHRSHEINSL